MFYLFSKDSIQVSVGSNQFDEKSSFYVYHGSFIDHPNADDETGENDVALLFTTPMTFSGKKKVIKKTNRLIKNLSSVDAVKPIRLPRLNSNYSIQDYVGSSVLIPGWGCTTSGNF